MTRVFAHAGRSQGCMFGRPTSHALTPLPERAWLQVLVHQRDDSAFVERELAVDCLEGRAVLPNHLDHP